MASNKNYLILFSYMLIGSVLLLLVPFTITNAQVGPEGFCENLFDLERNTLAILEERKQESAGGSQYEQKRTERRSALEIKRNVRNVSRNTRYVQLRTYPQTDEQVEAVDDFINEVEDIVEIKQNATDRAIDTFETNAAELLDKREDAITEYTRNIANSIKDIFQSADGACEDGDAETEVKNQVRSNMSDLRQEIQKEREQYSFTPELAELRKTRDVAIAKAHDVFNKSYESAKIKLHARYSR